MPSARVSARAWSPSVSIGAPALAVMAVTVLAGALRLYALARVPDNPFYDAAVRSMALSWHNFFFAAFEPAGRIAIDKPPVDLWLAVASVKLFGFGPVALKLPEALAGTASVPLLFDLVRRVFGRPAGFASALALAVLPVTVLTSRSDTMDTVMMLLIVAAAWLVVRAAQTGRVRFLYLAAVALGVAFNVKLLEALLPLPALALLYLIAAPQPLRRRAAHLVAAALVFVAVALSWVVAVSAAPSAHHPYPLGSTNGSVWNSVFVFDGIDRLGLTSRRPGPTSSNASATRLVERGQGQLGRGQLGRTIGSELVPALAFGALALVLALGAGVGRRRPLQRGFGLALALWLGAGSVAFSAVGRLQIRYLEAMTPAIAMALGIGLVVLVRRADRRGGARALLGAAVAGTGAYAFYLSSGTPVLRWLVVLASLAALLAVSLPRRARLFAASGVLCLVAALAVPAWASVSVVRSHATDASTGARIPPREIAALDRYLTAHQGSARYEVATLNAWQASPLIVRAAQPVLVLRNVNRRPLVSAHALSARVRAGELRYALLGSQCGLAKPAHGHSLRACPPSARWVRAHGRSLRILGHRIGLYRLSPSGSG